jgi:hypothetical protein
MALFKVRIAWTGDNKIQAIKDIRVVFGYGLKEAKDFVESLYREVPENSWDQDDQSVYKEPEFVTLRVSGDRFALMYATFLQEWGWHVGDMTVYEEDRAFTVID